MSDKQEPQLREGGGTPQRSLASTEEPQSQINYFAWAAATAAGIIIAYFAIRQYELYQAQQLLNQITATAQQEGQRATAAFNAQLAEQRAQAEQQQQTHAMQERNRRATDSTGAKLARQCNEWVTMADGVKKSDYATQEKNKSCGQLEAYVSYGTQPRP